jgi:hypothetical protein
MRLHQTARPALAGALAAALVAPQRPGDRAVGSLKNPLRRCPLQEGIRSPGELSVKFLRSLIGQLAVVCDVPRRKLKRFIVTDADVVPECCRADHQPPRREEDSRGLTVDDQVEST